MLGYASASVTLDTYAYLFDEDLATGAVALNHQALNSEVGKSFRAFT